MGSSWVVTGRITESDHNLVIGTGHFDDVCHVWMVPNPLLDGQHGGVHCGRGTDRHDDMDSV